MYSSPTLLLYHHSEYAVSDILKQGTRSTFSPQPKAVGYYSGEVNQRLPKVTVK